MMLALAFTVVALVFTWIAVRSRRNAGNLPPGPRGLPLLGYYPFLSDRPYQDFLKLAEEYGNVFSFRSVGGHLIVVLNGSDAIKDVLLKRADEFTGRPRETHQVTWASDGYGLSQEEGEAWKEHRRFFLQAAKNLGFGKAETQSLILEEVENLLGEIRSKAGRTLDLRPHVYYATSSVISRILFSRKFEKNGSLFSKITAGSTHLVEMFLDKRLLVVGLPFRIMLMFPGKEKIWKAKHFFKSYFKEVVEEHNQTYDPDHLRDYIDAFLEEAYRFEARGKTDHTFTRDRLVGTSQNLLMEGTESAGGSIIGFLDVAAQYPEEQKLVQAQLDAVVGRERLLSWSDRPNLPYLEAFILELYRHNFPFNISSMYNNFRDTTIQGYRIPQRTIIVANFYSIIHDSTLFPDPTKFNPKRFLDKSGGRTRTENFYPFGIGKRNCVGESLARMEVFIIIGAILQNFTIHPTGESGRYRVDPR